jgi:thiamine-phosphate pyrophosphorylase
VDLVSSLGLGVPAVAEAYLAGGARFLQIRGKTLGSAEFLNISEALARRAHAVGAKVIVNDRADVASLAGADGVHLGQDDLQPAEARRILGDNAIIGASTHSIEQVRLACRLPIDYLAIGPIFRTATKDTGYAAVGTKLISAARIMLLAAGVDIPIVAIGGITLDRAEAVIQAGAASVAVISDLLATDDPASRVREYLGILR